LILGRRAKSKWYGSASSAVGASFPLVVSVDEPGGREARERTSAPAPRQQLTTLLHRLLES
jgi:hypothetical protein